MGFDKFVEAETARTNNYSTQGTIAACERYTRCKRAANDRAIKILSSPNRQQLAAARRELDKLEDSLWTIVRIGAGGGTMYSQFAAAGYGVREDVLGKLIAALRVRKKSVSARRQTNKLLTRAQKFLAPHLKISSERELMGLGWPKGQTKIYASAAHDAETALATLKVLSRRWPDGAAKLLATRIEHSVTNVFESGD